MNILIFALLLLTSCTRNATISKDSFGMRVSEVRMGIGQLNEVTWWIGAKRKEEKVTQSITFLVDMPKLKEEDLDHLTKEHGVDSWIVRVIQIKGSQTQDLGSFLVPFKPQRHGRNSNADTPSMAAVKIFYAAAYPSERFRAFKCPAFGHDKRITSMEVAGEDNPFEIPLGTSVSYHEKSQELQLSPSSFNGGHSLLGQFHLEIAPYNSHDKNLLGTFQRIPRYVEITAEKSVHVGSCVGVHPELK